MNNQKARFQFTERHVRFISYIVVVLLAVTLLQITDFSFINNDYHYFLLTVGLDTILIFISEFLEHRICDGTSKEDYYLGKNLKHKKYYDNPLIFVFNTFPARVFLWITFVIPILILIPHIKTQVKWINDIYSFLIQFFPLLKSIWCSTFVVVVFVCASVLIESIVLNRGVFSGEGVYSDSKEIDDKNDIRIQIEREYSQVFSKNLSLLRVLFFENTLNIPQSICVGQLISEANSRTGGNPDEIAEYLAIVYSSEFQVINKHFDSLLFDKKSPRPIRRRILSFLKNYYRLKWQDMENYTKGIIPSIDWIRIARNDISILLKCEKCFSMEKDYLNLFCTELYKKNIYQSVGGENQSNKVVDLILDILIKQLHNSYKVHLDSSAVHIVDLLDTLHDYGIAEEVRTNEKNEFCERATETILRKVLDKEYWNWSSSNNVRKKLKDGECQRKWIKYSFIHIIEDGEELHVDAIAYILSFFDYAILVFLLIYRLAYRIRSGRGYIQVDEFREWKKAIAKYTYERRFTEEELQIGYQCVLFDSNVSHFLTKEFAIWICKSLSKDINDVLYNEFQKQMCSDFSFPSYVIIRLIVDPYGLNKINHLTDCEMIKESLEKIKDILKEEGKDNLLQRIP